MLGDGDGAAGYLNELLNTKILPNTMYTEGSPCIETPLSAATSLEEMLIASYGNKIRVFPAIPSAWRDVSFYHLRTEGAFLLSAARRNGKTDFIRIDSLAGEPCRIWTDIASPVTDPPVGMKDLGAGTYELSLAKGQSVVVHSKNSSPNLTIAPVESTVGRTNSFGATAQ
jgi:alpha-L-fucosidase 2